MWLVLLGCFLGPAVAMYRYNGYNGGGYAMDSSDSLTEDGFAEHENGYGANTNPNGYDDDYDVNVNVNTYSNNLINPNNANNFDEFNTPGYADEYYSSNEPRMVTPTTVYVPNVYGTYGADYDESNMYVMGGGANVYGMY